MNYKFKTKPYAHQMTALEKSWNKETYAYFMEMGTGKTKVLIDNLAMLYDKGKVDGVIIVAPKGVVKTWYEQELPTHLPDHIENVTVLWQPNITKKQQEKLETLYEIGTALHILIMNVEALSTDKGVKFARKFLASHRSMMAIDESTTIKNPSAKRTKNIISLGKHAKYTSTMTVLTQLMRLHQITCGHFTADDGSTQSVDSNRLNELMSVLDETEGKAIIWANYQLSVGEIIQKIIKEYGEDSYVHYYGLTSQEERQDNIRKFQNDPKCRFLIGTPQTGGYGITLTQANTVIYYSNSYDLEKRLQSEDRAHRIGQQKNVTYIDLIAEDTVDEKIVKALRDKINIASEVMGEELKEWI
jgi:SNF2 family DNA or RNA helicase